MTSSNLERLAQSGSLKQEAGDQQEFDGLIRSAKVRLEDARIAALSPESRFDLAYNAAPSRTGCLQQVSDQLIVDIDVTLVLGAVASIVTECEHTPDCVVDTKGVWQALEDQVAASGAKAVPAQRSQREGVDHCDHT